MIIVFIQAHFSVFLYQNTISKLNIAQNIGISIKLDF